MKKLHIEELYNINGGGVAGCVIGAAIGLGFIFALATGPLGWAILGSTVAANSTAFAVGVGVGGCLSGGGA